MVGLLEENTFGRKKYLFILAVKPRKSTLTIIELRRETNLKRQYADYESMQRHLWSENNNQNNALISHCLYFSGIEMFFYLVEVKAWFIPIYKELKKGGGCRGLGNKIW